METLRIIYESCAVGVEIALQKLWMRHLPSLSLVGGPAEGCACIVTGPTSGIGREAAAELARRGAHVVLACRSTARGNALLAALREEAARNGQAPPKLEVAELDLSSVASVRRFAAAWVARGLPLHILINNAGLFAMSAPRGETPDGFEVHMGTNHLGHFLLSLLLLPSLRAGAAASGRPARVVNVSSRLHLMGSLRRGDPHLRAGYASVVAYAQSKLAQVLFASELTRRAGGSVRAVAVHPGEVSTDVVRSLPGPVRQLYKAVSAFVLLTPAQGARCTVYCATSAELDGPKLQGAVYFDSNCAPGHSSREARDGAAAAWLWAWSAREVGLGADEDLPPPPPPPEELASSCGAAAETLRVH